MPRKPPSEWDEDYLVSELPEETRGDEHNWIEFKGSASFLDLDKLRNELSKQLSAFGNVVEGGYLGFGLDNKGQIDAGGVPIVGSKGDTKEWLERVIPDRTAEKSACVRVHCIRRKENGPRKIKPGHAVYVLEIPPHEKAPIQSGADNKFYLRIGGQSLPMSKQQIFDIANRQKHPLVKVHLLRVVGSPDASQDFGSEGKEVAFSLAVDLRNEGRILANLVGVDLVLPAAVKAKVLLPQGFEHTRPRVQGDYQRLFAHSDKPLFPSRVVAEFLHVRVTLIAERVLKPTPDGKMPLLWTDNVGCIIYADSAEPQKHVQPFSSVQGVEDAIGKLNRQLAGDNPSAFLRLKTVAQADSAMLRQMGHRPLEEFAIDAFVGT